MTKEQKEQTPEPKIKLKHQYTSELELKSLLIRIKNSREDIGDTNLNNRINKYIKWHTLIKNKKYLQPPKSNIVKNHLKEKIVELSVKTKIDPKSYERFGVVILLMIKNILKKPQFSGYTYKDDFYSDAVYKILKYLGNFNHLMISEITGTYVNAFAYISQYIHNSVLFIINKKKKDTNDLRKYISIEYVMNDPCCNSDPSQEWYNTPDKETKPQTDLIQETIILTEIKTNLLDELKKLEKEIQIVHRLDVIYPSDYLIHMEEYNQLRDLLKGKVSIIRAKVVHLVE